VFLAEEYDFGKTLVHGQPALEHSFELKNESRRVLRLLGASSSRPCCSTIGRLPDLVRPGESANLSFSIRPNNQFGRRDLSFTVRTDDPARPIRTYSLIATLLPEFEILGDEGNPRMIPVGSPGKSQLTVICRRSSGEGLPSPESIATTGPISARFVGEASETTIAADTIEATRTAEVDLPADSEAGVHRGEVVFRWASAADRIHPVVWQVAPRIVAHPSGIIVEPSTGGQTRSVLISASDRDFRITRISASFLVASSCANGSEARRSHQVTLAIDPTRIVSGSAREVRIETDNADQPLVTISVLSLPSRQGGKP